MAKEDLIPFNQLTEEEQKKLAKKGGKKSGEVRARNRKIADTFNLLLPSKFKMQGKSADEIRNQLKEMGINIEEIDYQTVMAYSMLLTTIRGGKGAVGAFKEIRDTIGEKPKEQIQHSGNINNPFSELSTEELRQLMKDD